MKGQIAIEMLVFSGIFLIAFFFIYNLIYTYGNAQIKSSYYNAASEIMQRFVLVLNSAYSVGDGFTYSITLPKRIGTKEYKLYLINKDKNATLILEIEDYNISTANELKFPVRCESNVCSICDINVCRNTNVFIINATSFNVSVFYNLTTKMNEIELRE
ncbi:MAG: hypothetical protein QXI89_00400 [Candidatus Anstonellales archaeon]